MNLLRLIVLICFVSFCFSFCPAPKPTNFSILAFASENWKQVGKYQTFNPFEAACDCTSVQFDAATFAFETRCVVDGFPVALNATLQPIRGAPAGRFVESFEPFLPKANLTIVEIGVFRQTERFLIEFDCSEAFSVRSYCFHVFTPTGKASPALIAHVQQIATNRGLNMENLKWQVTDRSLAACGR